MWGWLRQCVHHWSRWAVVRSQLLIDPFEFKFDRLNISLAT
jgi:hypothetical protein